MADKSPLNDVLRSIIDHQGRGLLDDSDRCAQVLQGTRLNKDDVAGLLAAAAQGIPKRLMRIEPPRITPDTVFGLAHRLAGDTGLSGDMARQSVEAWAYALRVEVTGTPDLSKPEPPKVAPKPETVKPETVKTDHPIPTPPPPLNNPTVLPAPPLKIKAALLTPVAAIGGGIAGIIIFILYYIAALAVLNLVFQHHLSAYQIGQIAGQSSFFVGMPCGVLAGISWIELRYKYDWLGWIVAAVTALVLALYPFVAGIGLIFGLWAQFNVFGIVALFGVFGISAKLSEVGAKRR